MFGGAVKGGKVLGRYPSDFNESEMVLSRGRMIPDTPWDAGCDVVGYRRVVWYSSQ